MALQPLLRPPTVPRRARLGAALTACALVALAPGLRGQAVPAPTGEPVTDGVALEAADSLLGAGDSEGAFAVLAARLDSVPGDVEARWRAVRVAVALSLTGPSHVVRRGWALRADSLGRELERQRPGDADALAWAAAARGLHALNEEGFRTPARLGEETWTLTEAVLRLRPDHPLANHVRGTLCQKVAALPAAARLFGRIFLGPGLMSQGTWAQAEAHHLKAVAGDPGMAFYYLDLGDTFAAQGKSRAAAEVYRRGLLVPDRLPLDGVFKRRMAERLEGLGEPPGPEFHYY